MVYDEQTNLLALIEQLPPKAVVMLTPSPKLQARVSLLLSYSKKCHLLPEESKELENYLALEHQVRMAKINAYQQLVSSTSSGKS